mmetsp:Transcript_78073/g.228861  ORF Transcript_78073/g.228861 Transcript_78073/m.228861 type:complete len:397 (-) Transcript_78073:12-1202(-)
MSCSRSFPGHHLRHLDGVHDLLVVRLELLCLEQRGDGLGEALHRVQAHALPEPALGVGRLHLGAPLRVCQSLLEVAQLEPALRSVRPDRTDRWVQPHGLRVVHGRLHEVARAEHLVAQLALLLRALPLLLRLGRRLGLRLLRGGPTGRLHWVLARVPADRVRQEGLTGARGAEPRAELHRALHSNGAHLAARAAPADGQARGVLVVDAADVVALGVAHAHRRGALVHLDGAYGMGEVQLEVLAPVHLDGGRRDAARNLDADAPALVQHDLHEACAQYVGDALALAEAHGLPAHLVAGQLYGLLLRLMRDLHLALVAPFDEVLPLLRVLPEVLQLGLGLGGGRALRAALEAQGLVGLCLLLLLLLLGLSSQGRRLGVPRGVVRHGGKWGQEARTKTA